MLASVRAGALAALVTLASAAAFAADKPFQRDELADSAIKLEAQIKTEAGSIAKPLATLRRDADAAVERRDFRAATQALALERQLSDLVNAAYGLTPEEVALMWATAPPRMPFSPTSSP